MKYDHFSANLVSLDGCGTPTLYTDYTCTSAYASARPTSDLELYGQFNSSLTAIANDKVRLWTTYYDSNKGSDEYFDSDCAIKAWVHKNEGDAYGGENVYADCHTEYNHDANGDLVRYDYFDISLSDYENGWYLTLQRFGSGSWKGETDPIKLSSSNVGKIYSVRWNTDKWEIVPESVFDKTAEVASVETRSKCDAGLAARALCGLHTCSSNEFNGYNAFDNYLATFVNDGSTWSVDDNYYRGLGKYYINDYASMDTGYSGSAASITQAWAKYDRLSYNFDHQAPAASVIGSVQSQNSSSAILLISIVCIASLAFGGYFFFRKRKAN